MLPMAPPLPNPCQGILADTPPCLALRAAGAGARAAGGAAQHVATNAATQILDGISRYVAAAATDLTTWLWSTIATSTTIDLNSPQFQRDLYVTLAIGGVLLMAMFLIQLIVAAVQLRPSGALYALKGLLVGTVGMAAAFIITTTLIVMVDELANDVVQYTFHTTIAGLGHQVAVGDLATLANPVLRFIFALIIIVAVFVVWGALILRKVLIIINAVMAPLAFAGAPLRLTSGWVRKWIEFMLALIVSKLLLVIVFMVGVSVLEMGAGMPANPTMGQQITQAASGALILLMAGLTPWVAVKLFHFGGDSLHRMHVQSATLQTGGRMAVAMPQKVVHQGSKIGTKAVAMAGTGGAAGAAAGAGAKSPATRATTQTAQRVNAGVSTGAPKADQPKAIDKAPAR